MTKPTERPTPPPRFAALRELLARQHGDSWASAEIENYLLRYDPEFRADNPIAASFVPPADV